MSTRAVVCHKEWTLQPDREPDAEPTNYAMQCAVCGELTAQHRLCPTSGLGVRARRPQSSHHTYREIITRPWRAWWKP